MTLSCLWIYLTIDSLLKLSLRRSLCPSFAANCKKLLDSGRITEHDGEMYCGSCYGKFFGPKGYGFGGGAGTLSMDDGKGYQVQPFHNPKNTGISTILKLFLKNEFAQWILYKSQWAKIMSHFTLNFFVSNQNKQFYLTENSILLNWIFSREKMRLFGNIFPHYGIFF